MRKFTIKKFKKPILPLISFSLVGIIVTTVAASCGSVANNPSEPITPIMPPEDRPNPQNFSDKKVNIIPKDTPYETIHNLEFSFAFNNTGGKQYYTGATGTERHIIDLYYKPYSTFGTGWLFDWKLNSENPDADGNINWTGYFGTNLHVIDALLNPDDGIYTPPWLLSSNTEDLSTFDKTASFAIGKYDNSDGPLSSVNQGTNLTYAIVGKNQPGNNTLPKTQFVANDFTKSTFSVTNPADPTETIHFNTYIDFAVMAITIKYQKNSTDPDQIAQNHVWTEWIQPAVQTLKDLYPQDKTNPNLTYQKMFDMTSYVNEASPNPGNIYTGGYPYYKGIKSPYLANTEKPFWTIDSPAWTINVDKDSDKYNGQLIDTNDTSGASGYKTPNGIYNANSYQIFFIPYHGQDYKQYGIGYILIDSYIPGGASGSLALKENKSIFGIYYGAFNHQTTKEDNFIALLHALIVTAVPSDLSTTYKITPYDLIGWSSSSTTITDQKKSYFSSLGSPTYLFSNLSA